MLLFSPSISQPGLVVEVALTYTLGLALDLVEPQTVPALQLVHVPLGDISSLRLPAAPVSLAVHWLLFCATMLSYIPVFIVILVTFLSLKTKAGFNKHFTGLGEG